MEVSAAVLAECFGVSKRRVMQMVGEGIAVKIRRGTYDLGASVKNYIDAATAVKVTSAEEKYDDIRAKHEAIKMRKTELTVMRMEGQLHLASDVERVWTNMATTVKNRLLGVPTKLAPQLVGISDVADIQKRLKDEIIDALNEVSGYDPAQYDDYVPEEEDEDEEPKGKTK